MQKNYLLKSFFTIVFFLFGLSTANASLQTDINQIIETYGKDVNVGIVVQSMNNGKILYQRNPNRVFNPASTMKVFTASAALAYLGPNYHFTTQFLTNSQPQNGVLSGNLYIKFTGDPELTTEDLNNLILSLAHSGIHSIKGQVIIDDNKLDNTNWATGWMWDEEDICYAAPATAALINRNCFSTELIPSKINSTAILKRPMTLANITINNRTITKTANEWECPLNLKITGNNAYELTGCIAPRQGKLPLNIAYSNPRLAAANIIANLFKQNGIIINGNIAAGKTPVNARVLAEHDSPPLSILVTTMLKKSDNLIADILFRTMGSNYFDTRGTWENGAAAVKAILTSKTGINFKELVMVDGAGLSRYNLVSTAQLVALLNYDFHELPANTVFYQALPIAGIDGTLEDRLKNPATHGKIHAKTGSMESTSGLTGYVQTASHQTYAFAILINGFVGKQKDYHLLEDKICQFLAKS